MFTPPWAAASGVEEAKLSVRANLTTVTWAHCNCVATGSQLSTLPAGVSTTTTSWRAELFEAFWALRLANQLQSSYGAVQSSPNHKPLGLVSAQTRRQVHCVQPQFSLDPLFRLYLYIYNISRSLKVPCNDSMLGAGQGCGACSSGGAAASELRLKQN